MEDKCGVGPDLLVEANRLRIDFCSEEWVLSDWRDFILLRWIYLAVRNLFNPVPVLSFYFESFSSLHCCKKLRSIWTSFWF